MTDAILAYLAAQTAETVTTGAAEEHLASAGLTTLRGRAALARLIGHGIVAPVRCGVYRIKPLPPGVPGDATGGGG